MQRVDNITRRDLIKLMALARAQLLSPSGFIIGRCGFPANLEIPVQAR